MSRMQLGMVIYVYNPALGRGRRMIAKFKTSLGYIVIPCLKKKKTGQVPIMQAMFTLLSL
jgi:hypothetical protein